MPEFRYIYIGLQVHPEHLNPQLSSKISVRAGASPQAPAPLLHSLICAPTQIPTQTSGLQSSPGTLPQGPNTSFYHCLSFSAGPPSTWFLLSYPSSLLCKRSSRLLGVSPSPLVSLQCGGPTLLSGFSSAFSFWASSLSTPPFLSFGPFCPYSSLSVCPSPPFL